MTANSAQPCRSSPTMRPKASVRAKGMARIAQICRILLSAVGGEGARHRQRERDAGRGRQKILHRKPRHLAEVGHRRLAAIGLPVGVGDKADRGVEGEPGVRPRQALRVERQRALQPQQGVEHGEARCVQRQHRQHVAAPAHAFRRVDVRGPVEAGLHRRKEPHAPRCNSRRVPPERHRGRCDEHEHERDLRPADPGHVRGSRAAAGPTGGRSTVRPPRRRRR